MRRGPLSLTAHAMIEPVMAILVIVSPWLFGFSDVSDAKTLAIIVGIVMLLTGAMTRWRYSVVKLIPLEMHFFMDVAIAALLIASPWLFGFDGSGGATRFFVIAGVLELGAALGTRWEPDAAASPADARTARTTS
jgi:hypothetical protein